MEVEQLKQVFRKMVKNHTKVRITLSPDATKDQALYYLSCAIAVIIISDEDKARLQQIGENPTGQQEPVTFVIHSRKDFCLDHLALHTAGFVTEALYTDPE